MIENNEKINGIVRRLLKLLITYDMNMESCANILEGRYYHNLSFCGYDGLTCSWLKDSVFYGELEVTGVNTYLIQVNFDSRDLFDVAIYEYKDYFCFKKSEFAEEKVDEGE